METVNNNRKTYFNYEIIDDIRAGIVLLGSEVKSIRNKDVSIKEAYCYIDNGEMYIKGMHIAPLKESGIYQNHEPLRDRKLLLNKKEIIKLQEKANQKGLTIVPLKVLINNKGLIKIDIGLARGKKLHDKRETIKERDIQRDIDRNV